MGENNATGSGLGGTKPFREQDASLTHNSGRRRYTPPRLLSSEPLELAAATCSPPAPPYGKTVPTCSPGFLGS
jgi:hypothetical protein